MTESDKRRAYMEGLKLKNSGLDPESIYARLEKQGFSEKLSLEVTRNVFAARRQEATEEIKSFAFAKAGLGLVLAVVSYLVLPHMILLPIGCIIAGIAAAAMD